MNTEQVIRETSQSIKEIVDFEGKTISPEYAQILLRATMCLAKTHASLREKDPHFEEFSKYIKKITVTTRNSKDLKTIMLYYKNGDIFDGKQIYAKDNLCRECWYEGIEKEGDLEKCGFLQCEKGHQWISYVQFYKWISILEKNDK